MYTYIIQTDDLSFAEEKIEKIKEGIETEYEVATYDVEDDGIYQIVDELNTISLFDLTKVVIAKSAEAILSLDDKKYQEFIGTISNFSSSNILVMVSKGYDLKGDKKERLNEIKKYGAYFEMNLRNISLDEYAKRELDSDGFTYKKENIDLLISYISSLTELHQAIEKLKCFKWDEKTINNEDINKIITRPLDTDVYELVTSVLKKDRKRVFEIYKDLMIQRVEVGYLLQLLINKFQELNNVYILVKSHMTQDEIAQTFNIKPGRAYYMMKDAKSLSLSDIKSNLEYLMKLDIDIKTGNVLNDKEALEIYFLR